MPRKKEEKKSNSCVYLELNSAFSFKQMWMSAPRVSMSASAKMAWRTAFPHALMWMSANECFAVLDISCIFDYATCVDIDECANNSYNCICDAGLDLQGCEITCRNFKGSYTVAV